MNKFYDLVVDMHWHRANASLRSQRERELGVWMEAQNPATVLSGQRWVGWNYTQLLRCSSEYQAFEARLMFGEIFTTVLTVEQHEGITVFK